MRHSFTPHTARKEWSKPVFDMGNFAPKPPQVPRLALRENVDLENQMGPRTPKGGAVSVRGGNPRFQRNGQLSQRAMAMVSPVVMNGPITPEEAKLKYASLLTAYETKEISDFREIYYLGQYSKKITPSARSRNNGFDDSQHHYKAVIGDHIAYRYEIKAILGKGAFGQVIRCFDHKTKQNVALKLVVNTELMHEQGRIECSIIQHLNRADPDNKHHIVRGLDFFVFRKHICVTFEILGQNLYEYSRAMRFRPIPPKQMKPIAKQMLEGLAFCHANRVVHCDMKPENVLLEPGGFQRCKIIDFGSSCFVGRQRYEYIQSRYYRAPEVILGIRYGPPMDIWSFACIVVEMIIGQPIFPGDDEAEQLDMLMEVFGHPPENVMKQVKRKEFFAADGGVVARKGKRRRRVGSITLEALTRINDPLLMDLLKKCFEWDQEKRITAAEALNHQWFTVKEIAPSRSTGQYILPELIR